MVQHKMVLLNASNRFVSDTRKRNVALAAAIDNLVEICRPKNMQALTSLNNILSPMKSIIHLLEADTYPTMSLVQTMAQVLYDELCEEALSPYCPDKIKKVIDAGKREIQSRFLYDDDFDFTEYCPVDFICMALDPRTKDLPMNTSAQQKEAIWNHINNLMIKMNPSLDPKAYSSTKATPTTKKTSSRNAKGSILTPFSWYYLYL
jgi:hypothetical protein